MARCLNILGLVIAFLAAICMIYLPSYISPIMYDKKTREWFESNEAWEWGRKKLPWWKVWLSRLGPILLMFGFLLQMVAAIIA
jgi:hypothetical protein